jgi:predicted ATP-grasp superfamily ATP-dependent carboligase
MAMLSIWLGRERERERERDSSLKLIDVCRRMWQGAGTEKANHYMLA